MRVWRLSRARHAASAFSGIGGQRSPGRWHRKGARVVYTSEQLSLGLLEILVHMDVRHAKLDYVAFPVDIPESVRIDTVSLTGLPPLWRRARPLARTQAIGMEWFSSDSSVGLRVPSAIVPDEFNLLLKPEHEDFARLDIGPAVPVDIDKRLRALVSDRSGS